MLGEPTHDEHGLPLSSKHARSCQNKSIRHPDWWYYEERGGITVVHVNGGSCWIPVAQLRNYLKRHDAKKPE